SGGRCGTASTEKLSKPRPLPSTASSQSTVTCGSLSGPWWGSTGRGSTKAPARPRGASNPYRKAVAGFRGAPFPAVTFSCDVPAANLPAPFPAVTRPLDVFSGYVSGRDAGAPGQQYLVEPPASRW